MLYFYKSGQATTRQDLLKTLGRSGSTVTSWLNKYRQGGLEALLDRGTGGHRPPALSLVIIEALQTQLIVIFLQR